MAQADIHSVRKALGKIKDPQSGKNILDAGLVQGLTVKDGRVGFALQTSREMAQEMENVRQKADKKLRKIKGVDAVSIVLTAHSGAQEEAPQKRAKNIGGHGTPPPPKPKDLPDVGAVIAVASGKGGVGKSTIAANLAVALAKKGKRVGLMDADIYGPSAPILLGLQGQKPTLSKEEKIIPLEAHGVKVLSMGFMVGDGQAVIWRGPMIIGALQQMFADTDWGGLDVLIVDMPPGTGDAQLTLVQTVTLKGALIAATPQEVALADVRRGVHMFNKAEVPILGVIENMAGYIHPATGERIDIFGAGGAQRTADELDVPFLGEIPLDPDLRAASDKGTPPASDPQSPLGQVFANLADAVLEKIA